MRQTPYREVLADESSHTFSLKAFSLIRKATSPASLSLYVKRSN
jgi:hypothetical protein